MRLGLLLAASCVPVVTIPCCPIPILPDRGGPVQVIKPLPEIIPDVRPTGRLFPDRTASYVELVGIDGEAVRTRIKAALKGRGIKVEEERGDARRFEILCERHTIELEAAVNEWDYDPPELVWPNGKETLKLRQRLTFFVDAHPTGLVRIQAHVSGDVDPPPKKQPRIPAVLAEAVLREAVAPLPVVAEWRFDPD